MVLASQVVQVNKSGDKRMRVPLPLSDEDQGSEAAENADDVLYVEDVDRRQDIKTKQKAGKHSRQIDESLSKLSRRHEERSVRRANEADEVGTRLSKIDEKHSRKPSHKTLPAERRLSPLSDDDEKQESHQSSSRRHENRRDEARPDRKRDHHRSSHAKPDRRDTESSREHVAGKSNTVGSVVEDDTADVLSVEATNKIRAKLGLPLLPTGGNDASSAAPATAVTSAYEQRKEVHAPPANFNQKREQEKLREKIQTMRERHELERRLLVDKRTGKFESIGTSISSVKKSTSSSSQSKRASSKTDDADEEMDDIRNWVQKSRSLEVEKQKAAERERLMQQMDAELGISELVDAEIAKDAYVDVGDLRVEHDLSSVNAEQPLLLTLKDAPVLKEKRSGQTGAAPGDDDEEDVLINVDMVDAEKTAANVATRRKMPKNYNPFEEASERWYGSGQADSMTGPKAKQVLSKYDEEIEGQQKKWFRLGATTAAVADEKADDVPPENISVGEDYGKSVSLLPPVGGARFGGGRFAVASDYLGEEEANKKANAEVKFKKGGKKKKEQVAGSSRNSNSKNSAKSASHVRELLLDDDGDFNRVQSDTKPRVVDVDDDDDYADVQRFLQRNRTKTARINTVADDENLVKPKTEPESVQIDFDMLNDDADDEELKPKIGGGIILDETSEFCRNIGDFKGDDDDDLEEEGDRVVVTEAESKIRSKSNGTDLAEISDDEQKMSVDDEGGDRNSKRTLDDFAKQYNTLGNPGSGKETAGGGGSWQEAAFETEQPELERHFRGRRQYRKPEQQPSRSQREKVVRAGSEEGQIEDDDDDQSSNFTGRADDDDEESHAVLDAEPKIGKGLASALNLVVRKNLIDSKSGRTGNRVVVSAKQRTDIEAKSKVTEDKRFDTIDDKRRGGHHGAFHNHHGPVETFRDAKRNVKFKLDLVSRDADGRELSQREAFQQMSHIFHGKRPGKSKNEKRQKKSAEILVMQKMSATDTPLGTVDKMMNKHKSTGMPYIVLSGGGGESKVGIADLVKDNKASK